MLKVFLLYAVVELGLFKVDQGVYFRSRSNRFREDLSFLKRRKCSLASDVSQIEQIKCPRLRSLFQKEVLEEAARLLRREREIHFLLLRHLRHL